VDLLGELGLWGLMGGPFEEGFVKFTQGVPLEGKGNSRSSAGMTTRKAKAGLLKFYISTLRGETARDGAPELWWRSPTLATIKPSRRWGTRF